MELNPQEVIRHILVLTQPDKNLSKIFIGLKVCLRNGQTNHQPTEF